MILFYGYDKCATCRKAKADLARRGVRFKDYDITVTPPSKTILQAILASGAYRLPDLFNRSGELYRELNMKERIKTLGPDALLDLLSTRGRLVKRPIVTDGARHTVGFDACTFQRVWTATRRAHAAG